MLQRLFGKVEGKQLAIDKEDKGGMHTDKEECASNASVDQAPVEHIAVSISKVGDNQSADKCETAVEFPKDVMSSDKDVSHTECQGPGDRMMFFNFFEAGELDASVPCGSTSSDDSESLSMKKCVSKGETSVTHDSSSSSSASESLDGDTVHSSNETENISAHDAPESCRSDLMQDMTANLEDSSVCDLHPGLKDDLHPGLKDEKYDLDLEVHQSEEATCTSHDTDTLDESSVILHANGTNAENQRSSNYFAELGFDDTKMLLPVAGRTHIHKCKSETGLHKDRECPLTASCPSDKQMSCSVDMLPVLGEVTGTNTKHWLLRDSEKNESNADHEENVNDIELHPKKNLESVKPKVKDKPPIEGKSPGSEISGTLQSAHSSEEASDAGDEITSGHKRELFNIYPCQYPYPCCTHSSCLYNRCGKLCTIFGKQFIFTEIQQIPILVSLECEDTQETALHCCKLLWRGNTPLALSYIEDGTEVMFDAIVMPDSKKYVAIAVWHTWKPDAITLPTKGSLIFLEEVTGFQVQLVSFNRKKTGVIKALVNGQEENITFSVDVIFLYGKKATSKGDVTALFQFPSLMIYTTLNKFLLVGSTDNYVYKPTCIWNGTKPNRLLLQPQSSQGKPYSPASTGSITPEVTQYYTLHCDVPGMLSITKSETKVKLSGTEKEFELKFILDNEVKSLRCTPDLLYCRNSQVSQIISSTPLDVNVEAHILKHRRKRYQDSWSIIMVQVPDEVVTKTLILDETNSVSDIAQKGPQSSECKVEAKHDSLAEAEEMLSKMSCSQSSSKPLSSTIPTSQNNVSCSDSVTTQTPSCHGSIASLDASVVAGSMCSQVLHSSIPVYFDPLSISCQNNPTASSRQFSPSSQQYPSCDSTTGATQCQDTSLKSSTVSVEVSDSCCPSLSKAGGIDTAETPKISDDSPTVAQLSTLQTTTPVLGNSSKPGLLIETQSLPVEIPPSAPSIDNSNCSSPLSQQYFSPCVGSPLSSNSSYTSSHVSHSELSGSMLECNATSLPDGQSKANATGKPKTNTGTRGCASLESVSLVYRNSTRTPWNTPCSPWSFGVPVPVGKGASSSDIRSEQLLNSLKTPQNTFGKEQSDASNISRQQSSSSLSAHSQVSQKVADSEPPSKSVNVAKQSQMQAQKANDNNVKAQNIKGTAEKGKLFKAACTIKKVAANTGIVMAKGKVLTVANPMAQFHHKVLYVDGVSLSNGMAPLFQSKIQAYEKEEWTCLLQKCKQQYISKITVNFTICLMWLGRMPTKQYNKFLKDYNIALVSSPKTSVVLNNKKPSNTPQNVLVETSSNAADPKPVVMRGTIKAVNHTVGTVEGNDKNDYPFTRHKCYLYDVCLEGISLNDVLSPGLYVQFECCSGKVKKVYIGSSYAYAGSQDPETRYYLISAWCRQYNVPLMSKEALLLAVGWLPPELGPIASTETKSTVVNLG